jgi:hypothetical protein
VRRVEMTIDVPRQTLPLDMMGAITDNLILILIFLALGVVLIVFFTLMNVWDKYRNRVKLDELESKQDKLRRYANYQKRRSLRDAVSMLNPEERAHLYSIWEDNSVVSRKALFKLNELEDRLRRAERGSELNWAESQIGGVKDLEKKIFPAASPSRKGGKK